MKKFILAALLFLPLTSGIADAGPKATLPPVAQPQVRGYYVYYRTCVHEPWKFHGGYYTPEKAQQCVAAFRYEGYEAFYR